MWFYSRSGGTGKPAGVTGLTRVRAIFSWIQMYRVN